MGGFLIWSSGLLRCLLLRRRVWHFGGCTRDSDFSIFVLDYKVSYPMLLESVFVEVHSFRSVLQFSHSLGSDSVPWAWWLSQFHWLDGLWYLRFSLVPSVVGFLSCIYTEVLMAHHHLWDAIGLGVHHLWLLCFHRLSFWRRSVMCFADQEIHNCVVGSSSAACRRRWRCRHLAVFALYFRVSTLIGLWA